VTPPRRRRRRRRRRRLPADKNQDNLELAGEKFKEIQNAYEILSDPHERSWYDSHRDAILRSGDRHQAGDTGGGFAGGQRPADDVDVYSYFSSTCYAGFGDGPRGFYSVYDDLFQRLAKQEAEARGARAERRDASPPPPLPRFGLSGGRWPEVGVFYAEWSGFATAKEFSWADEYNPAAAPNRQVRRAMDAENEKLRRAARREYNEGVRELVAFLRKRDKRVAAHQLEEARRRQERQDAEAARREAERQERIARAAAYQDAWESASGDGEGGSSDGVSGMLYRACGKLQAAGPGAGRRVGASPRERVCLSKRFAATPLCRTWPRSSSCCCTA
jgi:DnaJ family protein A protein 5